MPLARMDVLKVAPGGVTPLGYFVIESPGIDQASVTALLTEMDKGHICYKFGMGGYPPKPGYPPDVHFMFRPTTAPLLPEDFDKRSPSYTTENRYPVWITKL